MSAASSWLKHWTEIEPLLDELMALPETEHEAFFDRLPPPQKAWRDALQHLLHSGAAAESAAFMERAASLPMGTSLPTETPVAAGSDWRAGQRIGPWELLEELGRGGMASVWLARRVEGEFQREVALKLPHSATPHLAERLRREREVLARLDHPGIARLFDAGISPEGLPWLAMERVNGEDLLAWRSRHRCTVKQDLALLLQICDALQYAHGRLVIHRDIKPANVMVRSDGQVRLLDFGIARLLDETEPGQPASTMLTQMGQRPMTPEYASPEQVRGEPPGVASDIYALGVLAYRLLTGESPYAAAKVEHRHALEQAILNFQPHRPSLRASDPAVRRALAGDLDTIVLKALAKTPEQRYTSVESLATDLRRHLAGLPVLARGPSWSYAAGRFMQRHRAGVAASALAVVALVGTTAWALASSKQARDEARRAEAMYQFTVGLFNPDHDRLANIKTPDLPLKTVVERGAGRVMNELQDQPEARLRLLEDLVPLSEQLGLIDLAVKLGQARQDEARRLHGDRSLAYADALRGQSNVHLSTGQYELGYQQARTAMKIYTALGIQDPTRLGAVHEALGGFGLRIHAPDPDDARHLQRAIDLQSSLKEVNTLGQTYLQLGILKGYLGDMPGAYAAGQQAVKAYLGQFGPESWQTAQVESVLGVWADMNQRPAEAEALQRHGVLATRNILGPDNIGVARNEISLAVTLFGGQGREEALRLMADALRIVRLPQNAQFGAIKEQVQVVALGLAVRAGDANATHDGCRAYEAQGMKATTPYFGSLLAQACIAGALQAGDLARAARWLDSTTAIYQNFAKAPSWTLGLELRRGELAWAQGQRDEALRLWRHALALANSSQLAAQTRAWELLAQHATLDATERSQLQQLVQALQAHGGERYYSEFLAPLRKAQQAQNTLAATNGMTHTQQPH